MHLTAIGNCKGLGAPSSGSGGGGYCRTPREFRTAHVKEVIRKCEAGACWGAAGVFLPTTKYVPTPS